MDISRIYDVDDLYMQWVMKRYEGSEQSILSTTSILKWVEGGHFDDIVSIKKTYYNRPYIKVDNNKYILIENIKGKKIELSDKKQVLSGINCLARFHKAAEGYVLPSGIKTEANWGRTMEKYKTFTCSLERYWDKLEENGPKNSFEKETMPYLKLLYRLSRETIDFFRSERYIDAIERSMKRKEICINDYPSSLVMVGKSNKPYIAKAFCMGYNMCEEDVAALLRGYIEETGSIECINELISEYEKIRAIDDVSRENIMRMTLFPETAIKIVSKYMKKGLYREDMLDNFIKVSKVYEKLNLEV
ncbi:MAG: hypothetical protein RR515_03320 [Clostridium sp.]